jgi:hypothetical protein
LKKKIRVESWKRNSRNKKFSYGKNKTEEDIQIISLLPTKTKLIEKKRILDAINK